MIAECSVATIARYIQHSTDHWLWVATIRAPRDWFYSAVAQWCTTTGRASARCKVNTTAGDLVTAGWFTNTVTWLLNANRTTRQEALASRAIDFSLRYFEGNDEQSGYLGGIFSRPHFLVCTMERLATIGAALADVLGNETTAMPIPHVRSHPWTSLPKWAASVQWKDLSQFYGQDEALYRRVNGTGGCIARTSSPWLRKILVTAAAPLVWVR